MTRWTACWPARSSAKFALAKSLAAHIIRRIAVEDHPALQVFSCRVFGMPWTEVAEGMVRELPGALASGRLSGLGLWEHDELLGVTAWSTEHDPAMTSRFGPNVWRSEILAVSSRHQGQGHGRTLKQAMLDDARSNGIREVTSVVHWDNEAMLHLNEVLGGSRVRIIKGFTSDPDYCWCIVPVS